MLPEEIRKQVLSETQFIGLRYNSWRSDYLFIYDGVLRQTERSRRCCKTCSTPPAICCCPRLTSGYSSTCTCLSYLTSFLTVSKQFATEYKEVLFSQHHFVFAGNHAKTLAFFEGQDSEMLKRIRRIDLQLSYDDGESWDKGHPEYHTWQRLVSLLATSLNVPNVQLSIDAGPAFEHYQTHDVAEPQLANYLPDFYRDVIQPFREHAQFRTLLKFHVFWACFHDSEAEAEKAVMGESYDSLAEGKIPHTRRNPHCPHGIADPSYEWTDGMELYE